MKTWCEPFRHVLQIFLTGVLVSFPHVLCVAQTVSFSPPNIFAVGDIPTGIAIDDLDLDGNLDLVVTNSGSNTVSVLLGNGDGTFGTKTDFSTGRNPTSVATGDFNLDGKVHLAVANHNVNQQPKSVSVLLGDGTGSFGPRTDLVTATVGNGPRIVMIADFSGDGNPDLAVASDDVNNPGKLSVFLGDGTGAFGPLSIFLAGIGSRGLATADFNADTNLDLVTANAGSAQGTASVLFGDGTGSFSGPTNFPAGNDSVYVATADLNVDTKPDIIVANNGAPNVSILLGDGTGSFGPTTNFATDSGVRWVAVGDLNGDGKPDLVAPNVSSDSVSVLVGDGSGDFAPRVDFAAGAGPESVAIGDLNGDNKPDLAVTSEATDGVSILLNTTPILGEIDIKPGSEPNAVNPAGRGLIPVAILTDAFDALTVSPSTVHFGAGGASVVHRSGHLEDVDEDGDLDLVLHFRTGDSGIQCGDTEVAVTGETFGGEAIQGSDTIITAGCD